MSTPQYTFCCTTFLTLHVYTWWDINWWWSLPPYLALGEQLQESEANEETCHNFNYSHHKWFCWIWNMSRQQRCLCLSVCLSVAGLEPFWDDAARQSGPQSPHWLTAIWATWFHSIPRKHHGGCQQQIPMIVKSASIKCEINFVKLMN